MIRAPLAAALAIAAGVANASPADQAADAIRALQVAADAYADAGDADDRVQALTGIVRGYETGLAALRTSIRKVTLRARELRAHLAEEEAETAALLGVILTVERAGGQRNLFHPDGPAAAARAAMLAADITPALADRTADLRGQLGELALLLRLQQNAATTLDDALGAVQRVRLDLARTAADRAPPTQTPATDAATLQALVNSADTLDGFAASLSTLPGTDSAGSPGFFGRLGTLALPLAGARILGYGESARDGVRRPGLTLAVPPRALVTAPHDATVRYAGPFLAMGEVAILDVGDGYLIVLAGLGESLARTGDIVAEGAPLGLMPGTIAGADQILIESSADTRQDRPETLYIEIRQNREPIDPRPWFAGPGNTGR